MVSLIIISTYIYSLLASLTIIDMFSELIFGRFIKDTVGVQLPAMVDGAKTELSQLEVQSLWFVLVYNVMHMMYIIYSSNGQLFALMISHIYPFFVGFSIRGVVVETRLILTHIITIIMTSRSQILEPKAWRTSAKWMFIIIIFILIRTTTSSCGSQKG